MKEVILKDTTFRDGLQAEGIEVTNLEDALAALKAIDALGVRYHEVGFATAGETSWERIKEACKIGLAGRVCAFGRTHPDDIRAIKELHEAAGLPTAVLVGKARKRDVELALRASPEEYLEWIRGSVTTLVQAGLEVIYDPEHFFQAFFEDDKEYCLKMLQLAFESGASWVVLCDTNGKMTPQKIAEAIRKTGDVVPIEHLGIHTHNDRGRALVNAEAAWLEGIRLVEGTIGGIGERCGNLNLCTFIPNIVFDYGAQGVSKEKLRNLREVFLLVCDVLNLTPSRGQAWVGEDAFYTEAGMHQSGLERDPGSYWHADPEWVGNSGRVGVSDQSGRANLLAKCKEFGISIPKEEIARIAKRLMDEEANFGMADASLYLFLLRELGKLPEYFGEFSEYFKVVGFRLVVDVLEDWPIQSEASVRMILDSQRQSWVASGDGPVNALDEALRAKLLPSYPKLEQARLTDFKVRMVDARGTASKVRVLITFEDESKTWTTMGVHENIIFAAWQALVDGYMFELVSN